MVKGRILDFGVSSGLGVIRHSNTYNKIVLGSGFDASKRASVNLSTGFTDPNANVDKAFLDIGFTVPKRVSLPIRVVISLDDITVTREFKPQVIEEVEDGLYGKAVYEIGGLLGRRLIERPIHTLSIVYSAASPIVFEDAGLTVIYKGIEGSWHSMRLLSGALVLEPGDIVGIDIELPESRLPSKNMAMRIGIPSRFAEIKVEGPGLDVDLSGNIGTISLETTLKFQGSRTRIYINYSKPDRKFYPKLARVTSLIVYETSMPEAQLYVNVEEVQRSGDSIVIKGVISNKGAIKPTTSSLIVYALGVRVHVENIEPLEAGEEREFKLNINLSRLPVPPSKLVLRALWSNYGVTRFRDHEVKL